MPIITRKFTFDYAHRVLGHESKCRHLHGHLGIAEVTVDAATLDALGRVIDFGFLKELVGGWIDEHWDHNILLNSKDPLLKDYILDGDQEGWFGEVFGGKVPYIMENENPTVENLVQALWTVIKFSLPPRIGLRHIRLFETPNCWADYPN